jgi:polyhydroxyalkanoate synthesis regulator protein
VAYLIKRHSNRKMYDQQASRYIALDEIKQRLCGPKDRPAR